MSASSGHYAFNPFLAKPADELNRFVDQCIKGAQALDMKYITWPWLAPEQRTMDNFKLMSRKLNLIGERVNAAGLGFAYHNHDFEFSEKLNGEKLFDIIMNNTDSKLVAQQLDIGNMYHAGGVAIDILKQYPGRFELMHVKDEIKTGAAGEMGDKYESTILGKGIIPVKEVMDLGKKLGGTLHFIVEQESYQGKLPIDCVKEDFTIMKKWGY